ncbi:hypothetical protein RND81_01G178600 [Saponaria officinalis]|uniref:hAT-like transposase RNase-H fold domain-containing protein n=1 Tax=Saponaria officinalis TaxID=3572 RepID=A0AAW1NAP0_SAPOF
MCLTAHFIDRDWKLHKRVINFCQVPGHTGKIIGQTIEKCLSEWNLNNVLTVTIDNASSNDVVDYLKRKFNNSETDVMKGKYLHMRCAAHILNLVVKDGLKDLLKAVAKIRALVRYVRSSPARKKKFEACVVEEKIESKSSVCLDVETRWNSTYLMLESSLKFKKAFGNLYGKDSTLQKEMIELGDDVTGEEWKQVSYLLPFLKVFYDATLKMPASIYVTSNSYVEVIFGVGEVLSKHLTHEDVGIRNMTSQMKIKYDKYWGKIDNLNLLLFVSLILDPRWKLVCVEWMVKKAYGVEKGNLLSMNIKYFFQSFFEEYQSSIPKSKGGASSSSSTNTSKSSFHPKDKKQDDTFNFGALLRSEFEMEMGDGDVGKKTEWEKYLDDPRESRESSFNILQWWKDN